MRRYFLVYTWSNYFSGQFVNDFENGYLDLDHEITKKDIEQFEKVHASLSDTGCVVIGIHEIAYTPDPE